MAATAVPAVLERLLLNAPHLSSRQVIPAFVYGTAWKKEATADLVYEALKNGFTGIDTACQPRHYREDLVGEGLRRAIKDRSFKRTDIFIQTKFTPVGGQDINSIPYDPQARLVDQVRQSIETSLRNFDVPNESDASPGKDSYLDSVVLHSPMSTIAETMEVWRTLESYVPSKIHNLGISNVSFETLKELFDRAAIKPAVVQNRFYPSTRYDVGLRNFCRDNNIVYQSFWTLTGNPRLLRSDITQDLSARLGISRESALYCLVLGLGNIVILNGTSSIEHMKGDWRAVSRAMGFAESDPSTWRTIMAQFRSRIEAT